MKKKIALALLMVSLLASDLSAHQFYISITYIQRNPDSERLTVKLKVFLNDLEESIFQEENVRIGLWKNNPIKGAETYVERYVLSRLAISVNRNPVQLRFTGLTIEPAEVLEDNVIICTLEAEKVPEIATIKVHNSILTESIESQTNIVNVRANGTRKVINLDRILPEDEVSFN